MHGAKLNQGLRSLPADTRDWPESALDELKEREAIVEVLGKMPRARAEREAEAIVRARYAKQAAPGRAISGRG